jgi:hypothetical protein
MPPSTDQPAPPATAAPAADQFKQIIDRLKDANNVLITVSSNPSVDQLAACIGLTIALNKLNKHATAVFSGAVPSTIEFLEPEKTLEKNTDSLRDFIIALDKSKADKLRYKVEDQVVKIFITPYRTSLSDKDLDFSQGDFNIDAVVALGVREKADLDAAIVAHGRILHDATVISVSTTVHSELGSLQWESAAASSLCEMVTDMTTELGDSLLDTQIATALLTGIVAETKRFSNEKASPHTMTVSGTLMAAGASQQLVATQLEDAPKDIPEDKGPEAEAPEEAPVEKEEASPADGMIQIDHDETLPAVQEEVPEDPDKDNIKIDEHGKLHQLTADEKPDDTPPEEMAENNSSSQMIKPSSMILEPPTMGGRLTANDRPDEDQERTAIDPLGTPSAEQPKILGRDTPLGGGQPSEPPQPVASAPPLQTPPVEPPQLDDSQTLSQIEDDVNQPGAAAIPPPPPLDEVRQKVEEIRNATVDPNRPEPLQSVGSTPIDLDIDHNGSDAPADPPTTPPAPENTNSASDNPPPPVPPPMMPPPAA